MMTAWLAAVALAWVGPGDEPPPAAPRPDEAQMEPQQPRAKDFWKSAQFRRAADGTFPDAVFDNLREQIRDQLKKNPTWDNAEAAKAWLEKTAPKPKWTAAEVIALIDEAAAWSEPVVGWAEIRERFDEMNTIKPGIDPEPGALDGLAFGPPADNGLRVAWAFKPGKESYAIGDVLESRVIFHNSGKAPIQFVTHTWHQDDSWNAKDATDAKVDVQTTWYSGWPVHQRYVLQPGQFAEVTGHGVGIGAGKYEEEFSLGKVGAIVPAKPGDVIRVHWECKVPESTMQDGQGKQVVPGPGDWTGTLTTGELKFAVTAPDPAAAPKIGTASGPGRFGLSDSLRLLVSRTSKPDGTFSNQAKIALLAKEDPEAEPGVKYEIRLPDGLGTYVIAWERGGHQLWIAAKDSLRRVDYQDVEKVTEAAASDPAPPAVQQALDEQKAKLKERE